MPLGSNALKKYSDDGFMMAKAISAALNPDSPLAQAPSFREAQLAQDAIRETGVGELSFNPVAAAKQQSTCQRPCRNMQIWVGDQWSISRIKRRDHVPHQLLVPLLTAIRESDALISYRHISQKKATLPDQCK